MRTSISIWNAICCSTWFGILASIGPIAWGDDFPPIKNTETSPTSPLSPEETIRQAKLPTGFSLQVFASEPDVQNPIGVALDERGRMWVAENYSWTGDQLFDPQQRDRIVVLEDTDGDGRHDKRTVFWDEAHKLTSVEVGFGGVWCICLPQVLFIPDRNRDDVPDGPPEVVFDGIDEGVIGHNAANGLRLGPDGWFYARHGIQATSNIGVPGASDSQRVKINTGVWRFHPLHRTVEAVMHGMTNAWGFDFDQHGEMFVINTVIGHLWHTVPGAHVRRMYGVDLNPHTYQLIEQTADHFHWDVGAEQWNTVRQGVSDKTSEAGGGHAHIGLLIYQGDNWPEEYRHQLFTLNLHGLRINTNRLEREGAGYVGKRAPDFAFFTDPWFRGMELITGPDGSVYLADWSDTGECHERGGVHRTSGRIYKLSYGKPVRQFGFDLASQADEQLVEHLKKANAWWPRTARRILMERWAGQGQSPEAMKVATTLRTLAEKGESVVIRLRAMEALHGIDQASEAWLLGRLQAQDEHERVMAVRLLVDRLHPEIRPASSKLLSQFQTLAQKDPSGLVHLYLASALQRLPVQERWGIAEALASKEMWAEDRMFPLMLWYGIEPAVPTNIDRSIQLARASQIPLFTENIARRWTLEMEKTPQGIERLMEVTDAKHAQYDAAVLKGMSLGLNGWLRATQPRTWIPFAARLDSKSSEEIDRMKKGLQLVFGDGLAMAELRKIAGDGNANPDARRQALRSLIQHGSSDLANPLLQWTADRVLGLDAIRGLAKYEHPDAAKTLIGRWSSLGPIEKQEVVHTLSSRPTYARELLAGIRGKKLEANELTAYHARQIQSFEDPELQRELSELWGEVRSSPQEKKQKMEEWKKSLSSEVLQKANLSQGRWTFQQTCANCHVLYGVGKRTGPDLTGSNRKNLDYLLENILDPSASVGQDFRTLTVVLDDGRVINGVISEKNEKTLTLQTLQEPITIDRSQIVSQKQNATSLMPDGLLENKTLEQVRDLIAYLMATDQVPLPTQP